MRPENMGGTHWVKGKRHGFKLWRFFLFMGKCVMKCVIETKIKPCIYSRCRVFLWWEQVDSNLHTKRNLNRKALILLDFCKEKRSGAGTVHSGLENELCYKMCYFAGIESLPSGEA